jgi:hypothetical protein
MSTCPNKTSNEWKVLIENLKIYMIELDMYKNDEEVEQYGIVSYIKFGKGEIPNPVQGMRLIIQHDEIKKKRFEEYLTSSKRKKNYIWRIKSLPIQKQNKIKRTMVLIEIAKRNGETVEFIEKLKNYLKNENNILFQKMINP